MRLDFKVLWIDDQPAHVKSFREAIRRQLADLGFVLEVDEISSLDQVDEAIGEHIHDDGVDLVLVDYDLGSGSGGEEALLKIRKRLRYRDIVFYSANGINKLRKIAYDNSLDNVYFSTRYSLVDDTVQIIQKMLHKVMDVDHMRGVVMSATSDIDAIVEESLLAIYNQFSDHQKETFRNSTIGKLSKKLDRWSKELTKAEKKGTLEELLKLKHLFGASDRLNIMLSSLEEKTPQGTTHLGSAKAYKEQVIPQRNKLAHVKVRVVDGRRVLKANGETFTSETMTKLRCDLVEHRLNFTDIAVLLDVNLD